MRLNEIYSPEFIAQFGDQQRQFGDLQLLNKSPYVDLNGIANLLGLQLHYENLKSNESGNFDEVAHTIAINRRDPKTRQRFTIAHEIGHDVLGHHGISQRSSDLGAYKSILEKSNEMAANNFAATLLMPRNLLVKLVKGAIAHLALNASGLTPHEVDQITADVARELAVSQKSMTYRFQNVRMFVKKDD